MTYGIDADKGCIDGYIADIAELRQAVYKILMTERYDYLIYSRRYGIELKDLFGMPPDYVCAVLGGRIREALTQDNRISDVKDFVFNVDRHTVNVSFTVVSAYGEDRQSFSEALYV